MGEVTTLRVLSWSGYTEILKATEDCAECAGLLGGLKFEVTEESNADAIYTRFMASPSYYDVVVVDWEYRELYKDFVLELPEEHVKHDQYLEPFNLDWYELEDQRSFIPLRFGTNGVVSSRATAQNWGWERDPQVFDLEKFLSDQNATKGHVGVWKWWLPNMLLLARAAGHNDPDGITESQLTNDVENGTLKALVDRLGKAEPGKVHLFDTLDDVISGELRVGLDFILGPGEMVVAPISYYKSKQRESIDQQWRVPASGGLMWLEAAALSDELEDDEARKKVAYRFLDFLQTPQVQVHLMCGGPQPDGRASPKSYWSYPLNNRRGIDGLDKTVRTAFMNKEFEESAERFGGWVSSRCSLPKPALVRRRLPKNHERWKQLWEGALKKAKVS